MNIPTKLLIQIKEMQVDITGMSSLRGTEWNLVGVAQKNDENFSILQGNQIDGP